MMRNSKQIQMTQIVFKHTSGDLMRKIIWMVVFSNCLFNLSQAQSIINKSSENKTYGKNISQLGKLSLKERAQATDVWGYEDPATGKEYALIGYGLDTVFGDPPNAGVFIVDVSDPVNPKIVADMNQVPGFDMKTYKHFMYTVNGRSFGSGGIVDISDPANPQVVGTIPNAHNIFIDARGFMYLECPGLRIYNLNIDPKNPVFLWQDSFPSCHDATVVGDRLYDFHGTFGTNIYDVSDPTTPAFLTTISDSTIRFHHSGWVTEDQNFLFICDEIADHPLADITVWDISDLNHPVKVAKVDDPNAKVHNLDIIGNFAFVSYYTAGFRVYDISTPQNPILVDEFDTSPLSGEIFAGAFGVFPFTRSGNIFVSDVETGLHIFSFTPPATGVEEENNALPDQFALLNNFPNPFNPSTTIIYQLARPAHVTLTIWNIRGQKIRTLVEETKPRGTYEVKWDGKDEQGLVVPAGLYFYRLQAGGFSMTRRMILLK